MPNPAHGDVEDGTRKPDVAGAKSSKPTERSKETAPLAGLRRFQSQPLSTEDCVPDIDADTDTDTISRTNSLSGLRRTASHGNLSSEPTSPTHFRAPSAPPEGNILQSIAEQGSTAWMLMPDDDMFGHSALSPTSQIIPARHRGSKRTSKPKVSATGSREETGCSEPSSALASAGQGETVAIQSEQSQPAAETDSTDSPRHLDLSFWSQMSNDLDGSGSEKDSPRRLAVGISEVSVLPEPPQSTAAVGDETDEYGSSAAATSSRPAETTQRRAHFWGGAPLDWEKAVGTRMGGQGDGPSSDQEGDSDDNDQPWWANLDDLDSESEASDADFQGFAMEHPSEWSSDSSVDLDPSQSYAGRWPKLGLKIRKLSRDLDAEQTNQTAAGPSPARSPTWGQSSLWPTSSRNSQSGLGRGRHQRSHTADFNNISPDMYETSRSGTNHNAYEHSELSDNPRRVRLGGAQAGHAPSNTTGTSLVDGVEANRLSLSALALALSPRRESATGGGTQAIPSFHDGLRLQAMLEAVAVGGSRDDVLAAAERTPPLQSTGQDEEPPPPSPAKADDKPGTQVRQEADMLLKILRTSPSQSPGILRQLIALAEQPHGAEAIAKESGLDVVVMVMSSEWANRIVATMCAELLKSLLPGGIAMSRRKLLKRLPELQAGALSGVEGGLRVDHPPSSTPMDSTGSVGASTPPRMASGELSSAGGTKASGVILKKKHLKKLRKRSAAIAWACHALVRVMQRFKAAESVQDKGSSALWGVLSPPNVPQSMAHREIDSYIQRVAANEILEAGGVFVLINNLTEHAGFANVAYSSVGALLAIAQLGHQGRQAIERQQGKRAIRAAMTEHPAIGYGGRFASLAGWLESSGSNDGADRDTVGSSSSCAEDFLVGEDGALEEKPFKVRSKRMSLRRLARKAPTLALGASTSHDRDGDGVDLKHIRISDSGGVTPKAPKGPEEGLWDRIINAVGGPRRRDQ